MKHARYALNREIDVTALARDFATDGFVRIVDFLEETGAAGLRDALAAETRWRQVINGGATIFEVARADLEAMPPDERERLDAVVIDSGRHGFQFRYDTIRVPEGRAERRRSATMIDAFGDFMNTDAVLRLLSEIAGAPDVTFADAQATAYRPGDFLTRHDDNVAGKGRRAAYVFGLTTGWRTEWGGLLLYHTRDGEGVARSPGFNTLDLFRVPQPHSVSYVAPFADRPRLSMTGWLRSGAPQDGRE